MSEKPTVSALEKVEAILHNPAIYELARALPGPASSGRRRDYPTFMILVFNSLLSVWRSGRQVEAELSHPLVWRHMRRIVRRRFPDDPSMHLPQQPMRRHHYVYGRDRYLTDPAILERLGEFTVNSQRVRPGRPAFSTQTVRVPTPIRTSHASSMPTARSSLRCSRPGRGSSVSTRRPAR